ncbi:MAG: hypothetical protein HZC41_24270 [Chloroflexi bacterium]|nr:hypothetical protein [Chloroflexota bacterium]
MASFRTALSNLAALAVSGVAHNYDVDATPDTLSRAQLPALLVLPGETQDDTLFPARGECFRALAFSNGAKVVSYHVTHLLLVGPVSAGRGSRSALPHLADLIDAYFTALGANPTLSGALLEPARVNVEPGTFTHGGVVYHGCAFRHLWVVQV